MDYLYSIVLGIVQGLTEFLPISSSGHLAILHEIFKIEMVDDLIFDVALHIGTLTALIIFFYKDIIRYLTAFLKSLKNWDISNDIDQKLSWLILLSMIPAVIAGLFLENIINIYFRSSISVIIVLITVSFLFFIFEKYSQKNQGLKSLTWIRVLIIGMAQAIALIPGVSRSGITIIAGLGFNLKRETAAHFSFLISIPIVFAAGVKKIYDASQLNFDFSQIVIFVVGYITATLTGYFCVKYFLKFIKNHTLNGFAVYRILLGIAILIYLFLI